MSTLPKIMTSSNVDDFRNPIINGERKSTGLVPRNFRALPPGCMAYAPEFPESEIVAESEWKDRYTTNSKEQSRLLDVRGAYYEILKSLDQDGLGLCWAFSTTKAVMYLRVLMNQPGIILSAWYVAGMIKQWRDEGGWGAASLQFFVEHGAPELSFCPAYKSSYATAEAAANASTNKVTEWWDGSDDKQRNKHIAISQLLKGQPIVGDLNNMGHSMCLVDYDPFTDMWRYDNSWTPDYGPEKGLHIIHGDAGIPDAIVVPRVAAASPK